MPASVNALSKGFVGIINYPGRLSGLSGGSL
jgi:hypothetical protein